MFETHFTEVKVFDDELSELEILKKLTSETEGEEPFHMLNIEDIFNKHQLWLEKMPQIVPYYAVKCNPDATVIKLLAALGGCFDCASKREIIQVLSHGVPADRIIFANPIKFPSHIEYAKKVGVSMMTVDTEDELKKINTIYPEAKILIRIRCDAAITDAVLGEKFGCDPDVAAVSLIQATINLKLELYGFSFHVGSPCGDVLSICRGINLCKKLIDTAKILGCKKVNIIDIGGGIPGERDFILDEYSVAINQTLKEIDPSIRIIAEPGRYYVTSAFTSAAYIYGKKIVMKEDKKTFMYYVSDGVYGSFIEELLHIKARHPVSLHPSPDSRRYISTVWGPTCDSYDVLLKDELLPEFHIGDWLAWLDTGSYTTCLASEFNGFKCPQIYPIVKRNAWAFIKTAISKIAGQTEY